METLLIELANPKALKLIKELEELHLLKILKQDSTPAVKLSEKYAGQLPSQVAEELQQYVTKSRDEWDRSI
jgi:hypothetical protein